MDSSNSSSCILHSALCTPYTWSSDLSEFTLMGQHDHVLLYRVKQYGRWYVFKSLKEGTPEQKHRLQKEFSLGVILDHPNIVHTLDYGHNEQLGDYIRMEWIDGITLTDFLATNPSKTIRQKLTHQLIDALNYMHDHQMVHRDLKPSNILITRNGNQLKLIDFGLSNTDDYAAFSEPAGTLAYMAPEQLTTLLTDIRSDIYSLGKILQLLTPSSSRIARKCMRENPQKRFASCNEVWHAIHRQQQLRRAWPIFLLSLSLIFSLSLSLILWLRPDPRETIMQQAKDLVTEQYNLICTPKENVEITPQEWSETITLFYTRCAEVRDSMASTIEDVTLRNDFINTAVLEAGQQAAQFKKD